MLRAYGSAQAGQSGGKTRKSGRGAGNGAPTLVVAPNPSFSTVAALLHLDGANGGTTFTDVTGTTWGRNVGSATTSTVQKKYGTASLLGAGGGGIQSQSAPALSYIIGTGDFCYELWFYPTSATAAWIGGYWFSTGNFGAPVLYWNGSSQVAALASADNATWAVNLSSDSTLAHNTWHHIAFNRTSGTWALWINGIKQAATAVDTSNFSLGGNLYIGQARIGGGSTNYHDDCRYTVGASVYSVNFIPPAAAFPDS